jgi:membrane fusion protein
MLYRPEALANQSHKLLGSIRIVQPPSTAAWAMGALVVMAAITALMTWGTVTQRATVTGLLTPEAGIARLTAPAFGVLLLTKAQEGTVVQAGAPLFVISTERQSEAGATQSAVAQQLAQRLHIARQDVQRAQERYDTRLRSVQERQSALERELAQLEREVELAATRVALASRQQERTDALARDGFVSESQRQAKQDETFAARQQQQALERNRASLQKERSALQAQARDAGQQHALEQADAERALALITQEQAENEARRLSIVTAPISGTLSAITVQPGQTVQAGATLAQLIPTSSAPSAAGAAEGRSEDRGDDKGGGSSALPANAKISPQSSPLQAHFYAPTRAAGFVEPGQQVRLRYAAYPYQKFGQHTGTVLAVDKTPYAPRELPEAVLAALQTAANAAPEAHYRITVSLEHQHINAYGKPQPLKPGMLVEADIIQRTSRLWERIVEPLKGFGQRNL